jgi:hypothetical protein
MGQPHALTNPTSSQGIRADVGATFSQAILDVCTGIFGPDLPDHTLISNLKSVVDQIVKRKADEFSIKEASTKLAKAKEDGSKTGPLRTVFTLPQVAYHQWTLS